MNTHTKPRGNKAHNDKSSILADVKNLLKILYPAIQGMPKIHRIEGAPVEMKNAAHQIIRNFCIARECQDVRTECIREMIGWYGVLLADFELMVTLGLLNEKNQLAIAMQLERIEEGVRRWRSATRSPKRQDQQQVDSPESEVAGSMDR